MAINLEAMNNDLYEQMRKLEEKGLVTVTPMGQYRGSCRSELHQGIRQFFNPQVMKYSYEKYGKLICWDCQQKMKEVKK